MRNIFDRIWQPPVATQGAGKPARGGHRSNRVGAGVVIDEPPSDEIIELNRELLEIEAQKAGQKSGESVESIGTEDSRIVSSEDFVNSFFKDRLRPLLKTNFAIECMGTRMQFEPYSEGCNWEELGSKEHRVSAKKIREQGLLPVARIGGNVVVTAGNRVVGRISVGELSPQLLAAVRLSDALVSHRIPVAKHQEGRGGTQENIDQKKQFILSFREAARPFDEVFSSNESLLKYGERAGNSYVVLGSITAEVMSCPWGELLPSTDESPRVNFRDIQEKMRVADKTKDYTKIFGQSSMVTVFAEDGSLWPTAIIKKVDDTFLAEDLAF